MKHIICPQCGQEIEVWTITTEVDFTLKENVFGGICRKCLLNIDIKSIPMRGEEIRELAREGF